MIVYLDGKEIGFGDIAPISESENVEQESVRPKSFECTVSFTIGYGMKYVEDTRRKYWSKNWKQVGRL